MCGCNDRFLTVRTVNTDGFKPNLETQLNPLLATEADKISDEKSDASSKAAHHQLLMQVCISQIRFFYHVLQNIQEIYIFSFFADPVRRARLSG